LIHIAGLPVQIGPLYRQRCAWCAEILVDGDLRNEMWAPGSEPRERFGFEPGHLVEVVTDGPAIAQSVVPHKDGDQLPDGTCVPPRGTRLRLVPSGQAKGGG
jgi:hypothetical protein